MADISEVRARVEQWLRELQEAEARAALFEQASRANNPCSDQDHRDKQSGKPCLACEVERLRADMDSCDACSGRGMHLVAWAPEPCPDCDGSGRSVVRRMREELDEAEARLADYDTHLSAVMPPDFKDWFQNAKQEWPDVAARVVTNLRERLDAADRHANEEATRLQAQVAMWQDAYDGTDHAAMYREWQAEREAGVEDHEQLQAEVERLTHENKILAVRCEGTLANNLCPDHRGKQGGKSCLACEAERLEADNEFLEQGHDALMLKYDALNDEVERLKADLAVERDERHSSNAMLSALLAVVGVDNYAEIQPAVERLRADLAAVDAVLARRPALDKPTRAENIAHAIATSSRVDRAESEARELVEVLKAEAAGIERVLRRFEEGR